MLRRLLLALTVGALFIGCNAILGIEVLDSQTGGGGQGGEGTGGGGNATATGGAEVGGGGAGGDGGCNPVDGDGDTFSECDGDCDDTDEERYPGRKEICADDVDQNCDDVPDNGCAVGTYVSQLLGNNNYPGTDEWPVKTIAKGISNALALGGTRAVVVGEGFYAEAIELQPGVSVKGGHRCNESQCDWLSDATVYTSTVDVPSITAVTAAPGVGRATVLSGFLIKGTDMVSGGGGAHATIDLSDASPTIQGNNINGPTVECSEYCTAAAVFVSGDDSPDAGGPIIEENKISGGGSNFAVSGVRAVQPALIRNNTITGGTGKWPSGVSAHMSNDGSQTIVIDTNTVNSGTCAGTNPMANAIVVSTVDGAPAIVVNANFVNGHKSSVGQCESCDATLSCGGILVDGGNAEIINNIVFGLDDVEHTHAIMMWDGDSGIGDVIINANTLFGGGGIPTKTSAAIRLRKVIEANSSAARIRNNILDGGGALVSYGIREEEPDDRSLAPEAVQNNQFQNTDIAWHHWDGALVRQDPTTADVNTNNVNANANVALSCPLDASYHLIANSPCRARGTEEEAPEEDFDGDSRPLPAATSIDLGADERE